MKHPPIVSVDARGGAKEGTESVHSFATDSVNNEYTLYIIHAININQNLQYISLGPASFEMRTQQGTNFLREPLQCS